MSRSAGKEGGSREVSRRKKREKRQLKEAIAEAEGEWQEVKGGAPLSKHVRHHTCLSLKNDSFPRPRAFEVYQSQTLLTFEKFSVFQGKREIDFLFFISWS